MLLGEKRAGSCVRSNERSLVVQTLLLPELLDFFESIFGRKRAYCSFTVKESCEFLCAVVCGPVVRADCGLSIRVSSCTALLALIRTLLHTLRKATAYCVKRVAILCGIDAPYVAREGSSRRALCGMNPCFCPAISRRTLSSKTSSMLLFLPN